MVKLSKRMRAVASMVTAGNRLADIGTDHGYVPIVLVQEGRVPEAIAMDINEGPLQRAKQHILENGLTDRIRTRRGDGLTGLAPGEADSILIAGMGGDLVIHILSQGRETAKAAKELILQPQSEIRKVREFLYSENYRIADEDMIFEEGKYYPMMRVVPEEGRGQEGTAIEDIYGPVLLEDKHPVLLAFLEQEHMHLTQICASLEKQAGGQETASEAITRRIAEIKDKIEWNETAYHRIGGTLR